MDWPLIGAVTGVVVLAGAVTAGTVVAVRSTPEPPKKPQTFVLMLAPPPDTPGYSTASLPSNDDDLLIQPRARRPIEPANPPAQNKPNVKRPPENPATGDASPSRSSPSQS